MARSACLSFLAEDILWIIYPPPSVPWCDHHITLINIKNLENGDSQNVEVVILASGTGGMNFRVFSFTASVPIS